MTTIAVRERGFTDVESTTFARLANEPTFWALVDGGILKTSRPRRDLARLHGAGRVGAAIVGDVTIDLVEKVPGSLAALLSYASHGAFRLVSTEREASPPGRLMALLIGAFLARVRACVSAGVDFEYAARPQVGSLIGGRLDVARTVRLHAHGMRHMAAFVRPVISRDLPRNRVILAALGQIELLASPLSMPVSDTAAARMLAQFFSEARAVEVLLGRREQWASRARALEADAKTDFDRDLLALASVILSHAGFEPGGGAAGRVPRSWFVNLESLFEQTVRSVLNAATPVGLRVDDSASSRPRIFSGAGGFAADPDLLVKERGAVVAVGDVKYKTWKGLKTVGIHHDLYQLLVHAAAHDAKKAFLVYAHDDFDCEHLGTSVTGAETWAFAVDVRLLEDDLDRLVDVTRIGDAVPVRESHPHAV